MRLKEESLRLHVRDSESIRGHFERQRGRKDVVKDKRRYDSNSS